jgi:hypothetical protein
MSPFSPRAPDKRFAFAAEKVRTRGWGMSREAANPSGRPTPGPSP